ASAPDQLLLYVHDWNQEMQACKQALGVEGDTTRRLRGALREKAFQDWCRLSYAGSGVLHYKTYTKANRFMVDKSSLTCSQWTAAIKLNVNYANLAGVKGTKSHGTDRCRRCPGA